MALGSLTSLGFRHVGPAILSGPECRSLCHPGSGWTTPPQTLHRLLGGHGRYRESAAWGIAFDTIIVCVSWVSGCDAPTYVDDLAALIRTALQARLAAHALVFASWCAGLVVSAHDCRRLRVQDWSPRDDVTAASLLVMVRRLPDASAEITGLPPRLLVAVFSRSSQCAGRQLTCCTLPCRCSLKTALVPAVRHREWQAVMDDTVFTRHAVTTQWPYLGVVLASLRLVPPAVLTTPAVPPGNATPTDGSPCDPGPRDTVDSSQASVREPSRRSPLFGERYVRRSPLALC